MPAGDNWISRLHLPVSMRCRLIVLYYQDQ